MKAKQILKETRKEDSVCVSFNIYFRFHFRFNEFKVTAVPNSMFEAIKPEKV